QCTNTPCPTWNAWVWTSCSVTCGGGTRSGTRTCNKHGGTADCVGLSTVTEICGVGVCESWSGWSNVGTCSANCGGGTQQQTRTCNGGTAGSGGCPGLATQSISCNVQACALGTWSGWSNVGTCSANCGGGTQQQTRTCNGGTAGSGGCPGLTTQSISCNVQACPQGTWSGWSNVGTCSANCGGGTQQQTRTCNGGTAGSGGCPGLTTQSISCNVQACPQGTCDFPTNVSLLLAATCGTSASTGARVVGGSMATVANWPWTVRSFLKKYYFTATVHYHAYVAVGSSTCTGALIKPNVVLTAAHCVRVENMKVHLGVHNISDTTNIHKQSIFVRNVQKINLFSQYVYHPQFDPFRLTNDVAILFLSQPADVSGTFVKTICLPNSEAPAVGEKCWVTGFGSLSEGGALTTTLQEVGLPIVSQQACVGAYQTHSKPVNWNSMFCAGYSEGGRDACQGDSGGPLVCQRCNSCNWYLAGLVSYGRGCARAGFYGVYTRLTYFEQWVSQQTQLTYSPRTC
uniref:Peptidase S1 domain-containing protein n=1 Tax=Ciona savignyi TaxID=51511 RepID=H2YWA7_CIOSA